MSDTNIETLVPMYKAVMAQVANIDEQLDAAQGGKTAGRRKIINELVKEHKESVDNLFNAIMAQAFTNPEVNEDTQVALYFGLTSALKDAVEENLFKVVEPRVQKAEPSEKLSDEEVAGLAKRRSDAAKQAKYVRELLTMFGAEEAEFPLPKVRRGGGKRGARAISKFTWTLDGDRMPANEDTLTEVSKKLGFEKALLLRDLMKKAEINLRTPVDPIEFTLLAEDSPDKQSHTILGEKRPEEVDEDDDEDEDENGEEDEDETE